ncbi:hypothetical protein N8I77_001509 [Diaporthe amygdali]|uniref:Uncharacterized protein n=1 Tax=Phomopsis amygdali TaxID=1214568 RepID=A0AAD9WAW2_PHOAM|nr:hypothetical protein N8I77_001509 [Diaporthe amygdali]
MEPSPSTVQRLGATKSLTCFKDAVKAARKLDFIDDLPERAKPNNSRPIPSTSTSALTMSMPTPYGALGSQANFECCQVFLIQDITKPDASTSIASTVEMWVMSNGGSPSPPQDYWPVFLNIPEIRREKFSNSKLSINKEMWESFFKIL